MSSQAVEIGLLFDPLRDKSYQATRSGRSVVDFLTWKRIGQAAERTLDQYERDLARGCLMFPHVGLEQWTDSELLHVAASFKDKERRVRMASYRAWFKWGIRTRKIRENPCDFLPDIKQHGLPPIAVFDDPEISILTGLPHPDGVLMQILFDAGIRKEEATNLQVKHFRTDELPGLLDIHGKGDKWRTIPCTLRLAQRLSELILLDGLEPTDYLWYRRGPNGRGIYRDRPIGVATFQRWWVDNLQGAGIKHRNLHVTRHTHATRYLRKGGELAILSQNLGHASTRTTDRYTHLNLRDRSVEMALLFDGAAE